MRFTDIVAVVPLLAAAVDGRACKAKRPTTAALDFTAAPTSLPVTDTDIATTTAAVTPIPTATKNVTSDSDVSSLTSSSPPSVPTTLTTAAASSSATSTSTTASPTSSTPAPTSAPYRAYPADVVDKLRDSSMTKLQDFANKRSSSACTLENASIRREWSDLSIGEREEYITAVQCLQRLPAKTPSNVSPGARSRFDDFLTVHIQQTPTIHNTANFLGWHRYYVWAYEKALREECGYTGFQPYWNWNREVANPNKSAMFNGNATSLSGNSPSQGACVNSGPFKDMAVNLGPGSNLNYNPRCLKRNINAGEAQACTADKTLSLIQNSNNIGQFQDVMQGLPGVHAGGHFTIGGDPGSDIYSSAGDPAFYFHHAMIDRVWWLWQLQDLETRLSAVAGSTGSRTGTVNDDTNLGLIAGSVKLGDLLDTMGGKGGEFCYIYV